MLIFLRGTRSSSGTWVLGKQKQTNITNKNIERVHISEGGAAEALRVIGKEGMGELVTHS